MESYKNHSKPTIWIRGFLNDLNNLLAGTGIRTILVDRQLRIVRITPGGDSDHQSDPERYRPVMKISHLFPFVQESALFALSGSNILCKFDVPEGLWPCSFDLNQIGQVIDNLVRNAQQAMPDGGEIELSARNLSLADNEKGNLPAGNYVRISVGDSGVGIPAELLQRIFDPFFTKKVNDHGLGLATCYSILKRHGGYIEAESSYGKGAIFHLYLSAVKEVVIITRKEEIPEKPGHGGTVVVMDDDAAIRVLAPPILKSLGYDPLVFKDGKEAVAQIRKFDANIPVFVCSGYADDPAMANPIAYGFTASMTKPFQIADISVLLNKYCPKRE